MKDNPPRRKKTPHPLPRPVNAQKERENLRARMAAAIALKREKRIK